jgi:hypothetical protein
MPVCKNMYIDMRKRFWQVASDGFNFNVDKNAPPIILGGGENRLYRKEERIGEGCISFHTLSIN